MSGWRRAVLLSLILLYTAGCTAVAVKLVDEMDATVSKLSQSDCALIRIIHGMDVCRGTGGQAVKTSAYCYRTLGGVDCYDRADPRDRPITRQANSFNAGVE